MLFQWQARGTGCTNRMIFQSTQLSKIYEFAQDAKGLKVKFSKASRFEEMTKRFEQIAAKKGLSG